MSERLTIRCREPVQAHKALLTQLWPQLKNRLMAGHRMEVELRHEKRSPAEAIYLLPSFQAARGLA